MKEKFSLIVIPVSCLSRVMNHFECFTHRMSSFLFIPGRKKREREEREIRTSEWEEKNERKGNERKRKKSFSLSLNICTNNGRTENETKKWVTCRKKNITNGSWLVSNFFLSFFFSLSLTILLLQPMNDRRSFHSSSFFIFFSAFCSLKKFE